MAPVRHGGCTVAFEFRFDVQETDMATKKKFASLSADLLSRDLETSRALEFETEQTFMPYLEPARVVWREDEPSDPSPRALTSREAAAYVGVSPQTFGKLVEKGMFDKPLVLAEHRRWDRHALDRAMDRLSGLNAAV